MKILTEPQVHHSPLIFFSGGFNSSFGIEHTPFLFAQCLFMPVHLLIFHFSLFNYSGMLKISRRFVFPLCIRSRSFEDVLSFKSFISTGALSLFKLFNGVSFEWALTHRSFSRILPDSSYFPGVTLKFFSKFDVRMSYHQSNAFLLDLSNSFIVGSTFPILIPEISTIWWCFSSSFPAFEDRRRFFLSILLLSLQDSWF